MADMFEYLKWRGDVLFTQLPPNPVDALIISSLAYVFYDDAVPADPRQWVALPEAAEKILASPEPEKLCRVANDLRLLEAAAKTERFGRVALSNYRNVFLPEEDTQFSAITFYLADGTAFLAFRGTDNSLVGWKEDFNMSFEDSVPAQRLALEYVESFAAASSAMLRLGGHSKGGNLAVYAGARCDRQIQHRIMAIYNQDGPGFTENLMGDEGYRRMVPVIHTYVPQSSVIGLLMDREEAYTVIKSKEIGVMQHDPYSWEVLGPDFIRVDGLTADSRFLDRTFKTWLGGMDKQERNEFFDTVFDLLATGEATNVKQLLEPGNIRAYLNTLEKDPSIGRRIASTLADLVRAARKNQFGSRE